MVVVDDGPASTLLPNYIAADTNTIALAQMMQE